MTERTYHIAGWTLFILCAILYILSGLQSGDRLLIIGSIIFLVACITFLMPLIRAEWE
jgi:hypothetical protein